MDVWMSRTLGGLRREAHGKKTHHLSVAEQFGQWRQPIGSRSWLWITGLDMARLERSSGHAYSLVAGPRCVFAVTEAPAEYRLRCRFGRFERTETWRLYRG